MKTIFTSVTAAVVVVAAAWVSAITTVSPVEAASYNFEWQSTDENPINNGYSAKGSFSFSDDLVGEPLITRSDFSSFQISFYNPAQQPIATYQYSFPLPTTNEFNFSFNSDTNTILQSQNFNQLGGVDLGINAIGGETGLNFFTYLDNDVVKLYLNNVTSPCIIPPNDNFNPLACGTNLAEGGKLVITPNTPEIPESTSLLSLCFLGILGTGLILKKKN